MFKYQTLIVTMLIALTLAFPARADEEELLKVRQTTIDLIQELVNEGVFSQEQAQALIKRAEEEAAAQIEQQKEEDKIEPGTVRVPYVPETVKEEIKARVRAEVREDVTQDVLGKAKQERWGVPGVLPEWADRYKLYGDIRMRAQHDGFDDETSGYLDFQAINEAGSVDAAGTDAFLNTNEDRERLRVRVRLGLKAEVTQGWLADIRLATGGFDNPVSTNQTLGGYNTNFRVALDRAYMRYTSQTKYFNFWGGRMVNPWLYTDLVWDDDLNFDGVAVKLRYRQTNNPMIDRIYFDPFVTVGAFSLAEFDRFNDKWLLGAQTGFEWTFLNQSKLSVGLGYYDYQNIDGRTNPTGSNIYDHTAPDFVQKGNSMFDIRDDGDFNPNNDNLYALASDYDLLNVTVKYDLATFAPLHIYFTGDYVKNLGYEINEDAQTDPLLGDPAYAEETEGWQMGLSVGWPLVRERGTWRVFVTYKELERDAVLDAFTDSDFHLGGTDAKGFTLGGKYALNENVTLNLRWISTEVINGEQMFGLGPFKVETAQIDLSARF